MRILALIPARGGSKRLPGKNIKELGGKPLIHWTIEAAKGAEEICEVLVSTDDEAIAEVARRCGACVPWLRPAALATDTAGSADVALHALGWYQANVGHVDGLLLLQPTSPFRTRDTIRRGIELFVTHGMKPVLGVSLVEKHPMWCMKMHEGTLIPFMSDNGLDLRSQELPPVYVVNGCFYLITPTELMLNVKFQQEGSIPLIINSPHESLDIDTQWDWSLAEFMLGDVLST